MDDEKRVSESQFEELDASHASEYEPPSGYQVHWRTMAAIFSLAMGNVCAAVSNTSNTTIRAQIASLGDSALSSWVANSNFLVTLAFGPVFGFLSDRFGKKWFIVVAAAIGVAGGVTAGSARSLMTIIGGQALSGLANAGCIIGVPTALEVTPNRYRPWTQGFLMTLASAAVVAGTLAAGAFVRQYREGWRWSYYLNACVYGATCLLVLVFYHPPPTGLRRQYQQQLQLQTTGASTTGMAGRGRGRGGSGLTQHLSQIDYVGIVLFTGSLASLMVGLTWGGTTYAWSSGRVVACLVAGCVGLAAFGAYEAFGTSRGLLDHRLFASRNFPILLAVCTIDGMLLLGVNVLLSQQVAIVFTQDAFRVAVDLMPFLVTSAFGCLPAGWLMGRTRRYRLMLVVALAWCSLFTGLMALLNPERINYLYAFTALFGIGTAVTTVIPVTALSLSVPSFLLGTAGTLSISARALGGIIGITIFTAIYDNKMGSALPLGEARVLGAAAGGSGSLDVAELLPQVLAAFDAASPPAALAEIQGLPPRLIPAVLGAFADANTYAWRYVWIAIAVVVAANAVLSCFLVSVRDRMNGHIESALEESEVRQKQIMAAAR